MSESVISVQNNPEDRLNYLVPHEFLNSERLTPESMQIIDSLVEKFANKINKDKNTNVYLAEKNLRLVKDSLSLINFLIEKEFDAIFMLDKSARNAGHFIKKLWQALQEQGKIEANKKFPEIKFLNIGQEHATRVKYGQSPEILKDTLSPHLKSHNKVLVLDEFTRTGNTLKLATSTLEQLFPNKEIVGASHLSDIPDWYLYDNFKGVKDSDVSVTTFAFMDMLSDDPAKEGTRLTPVQFQDLFDLYRTFKNDLSLTSYLFKALFENRDIFETKEAEELSKRVEEYCQNHNLDENLIFDTINSLIQSLPEKKRPAKEIIDYFKTTGGFFSLPYGKQKNHLVYRRLLTELADLSANYIQPNT